MVPVTFLLDPEHYKQVSHLVEVEEFTLHIPPLIWEWATYFHLKNAGHDVRLSDKMPVNGIVVVSACIYPLMQKPPENVLLISTLADSPPRFFAHVNVSQNPWQYRDYPKLFDYPVWRHINIWPQPGIVPRDSSRGERFERIGFFGHYDQLERSLQTVEFQQALAERGLAFKIVDRDFCDYSDVDAAIAVRDYTGNLQFHKPASKLINAWSAGVPLLTTGESAYIAIRKSPLDFIEISNTTELLAGFDKLKANPALVKEMAANGKQRVSDFTQEKILNEWEQLLFTEAQSYYETWIKKSSIQKEIFLANQLTSRLFRSVKNRIKKRFQKS